MCFGVDWIVELSGEFYPNVIVVELRKEWVNLLS